MCNIEDIVVNPGLFGKIWDMPVTDIPKYIETHSWVYAVQSYNAAHNIVLIISHGTNQPKRKMDRAIMYIALDNFQSVIE